ncbi:MAG: hypothetical protein JRF60_12900 [Deltaproteobacteria bacterium]|nr:hypothetical protein [Deltaproteobacteria bacterium]
MFPEEFGNLIIDQNGGPVDVVEHRCIDDFRYLVQAAVKSNKNGGKPEESLLHTLNALCGGAKVTATPEETRMRCPHTPPPANRPVLCPGRKSKRNVF